MGSAFSLPLRSRETELMDREPADFASFSACLRDLERVNRASFGYRPTLSWLDGVVGERRRLSILDVGSGHGDLLRRIWRWAQARGVAVELTGVDINPLAARSAREATPRDMGITYETADLFEIGSERSFDVILSALFAHHLSDAELLRFLRWMEDTARVGWHINDLHRHWVADRGLRAIFGALPVHRFVRHDGPVSVRRAFARDDLVRLVAAAALPEGRAKIRWHFPFRWGVGTVAP